MDGWWFGSRRESGAVCRSAAVVSVFSGAVAAGAACRLGLGILGKGDLLEGATITGVQGTRRPRNRSQCHGQGSGGGIISREGVACSWKLGRAGLFK